MTFLALYLFSLSLWPCADETLPLNGQERTVIAARSATGSSQTTHDHHDQCSPFCTCACCAVTIISVPIFKYTPSQPLALVSFALASYQYVQHHWADALSAIWQPPKLY